MSEYLPPEGAREPGSSGWSSPAWTKPPKPPSRRRRRRLRKKQRLAAMSRGRRVARRFALAGTWALGIVAAVMVAAVLMFYSFTRVPAPSDLKVDQVASILYSNGKLMARVGTGSARSSDWLRCHVASASPAVSCWRARGRWG